MSSAGVRTVPRRRNGKHQACEPCRKAKVACDHTLPVCSRCQRRNWPGRCVYLDAPMTRAASENGVDVVGVADLLTPALSAEVTTSPSTHGACHPDPEKEITRTCPKSKSGFPGYFGPTAFSSVFDENQDDLGHNIPVNSDTEPDSMANEDVRSHTYTILGSESRCAPRISLGINVLRALPDHSTCKFLMDFYGKKFKECVFHKPSIMEFANSMWTIHAKQLEEPRRQQDLETFSRVLCTRSETSVCYESETYKSWLRVFSGENLRWESIGSIFAAIISAILSLPERDAFFCTQNGQRANRKNFAVEMKDCLQACITLASYMDNLNVLMVGLLAKNLILSTVLSGDTSLLVWRQLGDLVSVSTALGLHHDMDIDQPITFITELRRRIFAVVFCIDKGSSLLTGRPPALSYRYCKFKIPLDLSEEEIMREDDLERAVASLDAEGWRTDAKFHGLTVERTHAMLAIVLDEILEVSLGDFGNCTDRIKYLSDRVDQTYASFPPFMHWNINMIGVEEDDEICYNKLSVRLHALELKLLLNRMAYKHNLQNGQELVDCARELLELVVSLWVQRDRFVAHHHDYDWTLMVYGVPSAGVLCVELLKQMKATPGTYALHIPRSEIVQNLSLLIGFFEWVRPAAGNYKLCGRMRHIIKRILDQILNPPPQQQQIAPLPSVDVVPFEGGGPMQMVGNAVEQGAWDMGLDDLNWLDDIDWSRGPWIDLGGQDFAAARWS